MTTADHHGTKRLHKLQERSKHIDEQIAELTDKKGLIEHEIKQLQQEQESEAGRECPR